MRVDVTNRTDANTGRDTNVPDDPISAAMKRRRINSIQELAARLGVHQATVYRLRNGDTVPNGRTLAKLQEVLGVQARDILAHVERNR